MNLTRITHFFGLENRSRFILNMKISALLSIVMVFSSFANSYSQVEISIEAENQPIIKVLDEIESETNLRFIFGSEIYDFQKLISISVDKAKLNEVIKLIFENRLSYDLNENVVLLKKSSERKSISNIVQTKSEVIVTKTNQEDIVQIIVEGNVTDTKGNPLPGASVIESGTGNGTTTDFDGNFSLTVDEENPTLEVTFIGFIAQNVVVDGDSSVNIMLMDDIAGLDEIVLTGYGSQNKRDITSSIAVLDLEGVSEKANVDLGQLLQARAAGVRVVQNTGKPGASPQIFIRGISSLSGNTQPLYVIDGVVSYSTAAIDPNNIEDITVLKDASAAGIYGAAGASNGVVLITTKKGKAGTFKANVNTYTGSSQLINKIPLLSASQLDDYLNELNDTSVTYSAGVNNDWQDLLYQTAAQTGVNASVSGGSESGSFYVGLGYLNQEGIVRTSENKRYSLAINLDQEVNDWLSFGTHFTYTRSNIKSIPDDMGARYGGAISSALQTPPFQEIFDENGFYTVSAGGTGFGLENPLSYVYSTDNLNVINNMVADANFAIQLPYNLTFKSQIGIILSGNRFNSFRDPTLNGISAAYNGEGQYNTGETLRYIFDNTLSYDEVFDKHKLGVVIGSSISDENRISSAQTKRNFASETVRTLNTASENFSQSSDAGSWSLESYFARANYSYDDKYLLTASIRTDGSSRIAPDNRWGEFKTISAGWNLSNESFMEGVDFLQNLKLRAGYGETGNLPSALNAYANIVNVSVFPADATNLNPGRLPSTQAGNADLQWETSDQINVGLDFSVLDNRIYISADYYTKRTENMIFPSTLPKSTGFLTKVINLDGVIENTGFEFAINASLVNTSDFSWNSSLNMSFNDNIVMDIPEDEIIFSTRLQNLGGNLSITKNGIPIGSFWGLNAEGVDPQTGDMIFTDNNGDGTITPDDKQVIGNPMPDFTYGFVNEFSYKNFDLNVVIDGSYGNEIYNTGKQNLQSMRFSEQQSADVADRWRNPGDQTDMPRATLVDSNLNSFINTRWIEDGSYLRVRDISLSYNFGQNVVEKLSISGLRIYGNLKNWFTITNYSGYSPEVNRSLGGVDSVALTQGVDYGTYPQSKTFSVGLNVEF
jgi:TonB-linked SusC/RagA family outer membrane protein